MAKPYDATVKQLVNAYPLDWIRSFGLPFADEVEVVDADLSTISTQADRVFHIKAPVPWVMHLELQAQYDAGLLRRVLRYNVLLSERFNQLPVLSTLVLLHRDADAADLARPLECLLPDGSRYLEFRCKVVRIWEQPVESILQGGIGILPLAPLAALAGTDVSSVIQAMKQRIDLEVARPYAATLWASTYVLMGLRYTAEVSDKLLEGVIDMSESSTYQAILNKGRDIGKLEGLREALIRLGQKHLGTPDAQMLARVQALADVGQLEEFIDHVHAAESWDELLR
jgi:hypothetical protein